MIERLACSPAGPWLAHRDWQAAGPAEVACRPEAPGRHLANLNFEAAVRLTGTGILCATRTVTGWCCQWNGPTSAHSDFQPRPRPGPSGPVDPVCTSAPY